MPAGTITDGANYEYCWVATDQFGVQWVSDWYTFNTIDATSTAEAASPVSALIDGDDDNIFTWRHIISTGSAQTKAELQKKTEDGDWESLVTVTGPETSTIIPGNSFTSGSWYWRVRTYNADSVGTQVAYDTFNDLVTYFRNDSQLSPDWNRKITLDYESRK